MGRDFVMFKFIKVSIICMLLLTPRAVWAVHPFAVDDAATEGKGNFLFEFYGVYAKDKAFKSTKETAAIAVGVSEHTDLSLEVPYLLLDPSPVRPMVGPERKE
jgi:hypothetical protein